MNKKNYISFARKSADIQIRELKKVKRVTFESCPPAGASFLAHMARLSRRITVKTPLGFNCRVTLKTHCGFQAETIELFAREQVHRDDVLRGAEHPRRSKKYSRHSFAYSF